MQNAGKKKNIVMRRVGPETEMTMLARVNKIHWTGIDRTFRNSWLYSRLMRFVVIIFTKTLTLYTSGNNLVWQHGIRNSRSQPEPLLLI
jgi:hypothetical protein